MELSTFTNFKWKLDLDALFQGAAGYTTNFGSAGYGGISGRNLLQKKFQFENRSLLGANGDIEVLKDSTCFYNWWCASSDPAVMTSQVILLPKVRH